MIIEPATLDDVLTIAAMRTEASLWLRERGVRQWEKPWPTREAMLMRIAKSIQAGETWMVRNQSDGATAATVTLDTFADPKLWTLDEQREPAIYLHRLIVRRGWEGLGARILDWACVRAASLGNKWVRVDVWTNNEALHAYYLRHNFRHVRTLDLDDYPSGALFQRPASPSNCQPPLCGIGDRVFTNADDSQCGSTDGLSTVAG